ncbi:MAG: 4-(cytidine 5'-diphospho)-2-C-methyl-D-erythritol kinase [Ignavibacteria bacterium]|nr:4-(cytidine 5'-diphospho)-2-C-methyl-D-erythritol kinase [Ignavibacteria bacterium]
MDSIVSKAPSKINIGLYIISKRSDNFHNLLTLFYPIHDLFDTLVFKKSDQFEFRCNDESLPIDSSNLVVKAKELIENTLNREINVSIFLEKHIPSQAGLGGGSSDAATTLNSLNYLFSLNLSENILLELALKLGSDVPFFLNAQPSIGKSRGEILSNLKLCIKEPILIVYPRISISTKEAFQNISPHETMIHYEQFLNKDKLDYNKLREGISNDFEKYVFNRYPEIERIKNVMYEHGSIFSQMSGSGSTIYGVFSTYEDAKRVSDELPKDYFKFISSSHN